MKLEVHMYLESTRVTEMGSFSVVLEKGEKEEEGEKKEEKRERRGRGGLEE